MAIESYEITILVGMLMLLVWYNTLPYDSAMFDVWHNKAKQPSRDNHILQKPSMTRISEKTNPFNIGYIVEEIAKIVVYFVTPSLILYKMLTVVKRELKFNIGY